MPLHSQYTYHQETRVTSRPARGQQSPTRARYGSPTRYPSPTRVANNPRNDRCRYTGVSPNRRRNVPEQTGTKQVTYSGAAPPAYGGSYRAQQAGRQQQQQPAVRQQQQQPAGRQQQQQPAGRQQQQPAVRQQLSPTRSRQVTNRSIINRDASNRHAVRSRPSTLTVDHVNAHLRTVLQDDTDDLVRDFLGNASPERKRPDTTTKIANDKQTAERHAQTHRSQLTNQKSTSWFTSVVGGRQAEVPKPNVMQRPAHLVIKPSAAAASPVRTTAAKTGTDTSHISSNPKQHLRDWINAQAAGEASLKNQQPAASGLDLIRQQAPVAERVTHARAPVAPAAPVAAPVVERAAERVAGSRLAEQNESLKRTTQPAHRSTIVPRLKIQGLLNGDEQESNLVPPLKIQSWQQKSESVSRSPSWSDSETEECAWAPGSPTGRQGCDLVAAKKARQSALMLGNSRYTEYEQRGKSVSSEFVPDSPEASPSWSEDETEECAWAPGSPTGQQGSDLVTAKKKRQQQMTASGLFSDTGTYATPDSARCIGELQAEYKATAAKAAKLSVPIFGGNIDTDARIVPAIEEALRWLDEFLQEDGLWQKAGPATEVGSVRKYADETGSFPLEELTSCHSLTTSLKHLLAEIPGGLVDAITTASLLDHSAGPSKMVRSLTERLSQPKMALLSKLLEHWRRLIREPRNGMKSADIARGVANCVLLKPSPLVMDSMLITPMQVLIEAPAEELQLLHDAFSALDVCVA